MAAGLGGGRGRGPRHLSRSCQASLSHRAGGSGRAAAATGGWASTLFVSTWGCPLASLAVNKFALMPPLCSPLCPTLYRRCCLRETSRRRHQSPPLARRRYGRGRCASRRPSGWPAARVCAAPSASRAGRSRRQCSLWKDCRRMSRLGPLQVCGPAGRPAVWPPA